MSPGPEAGPLGPPQDTEGLVLSLYHHLWLKDQHGQSCPVNIPHTVLFQNSQPVAWYFTSLKAGTILQKKRSSMQGPAMAETFVAGKASQPHVCAWFSGKMSQLQSSALKTRWGPEAKERDTEELAMEYLTYDRVQSILVPGPDRISGEQLYDGLLQRFVEPRDQYDSVIRVQWSPTSSTLEKRVCRHRLDGTDGTLLPDRIASYFFSPSHHQCLPIVEGVLQNKLQAQCEAMASHIKDVTRGQSVIARMELFFKVDCHNRIWLLYCSSLKMEVVPPLRVVYNREMEGGAFVLKDPARSEQVQLRSTDKGMFVCALSGEALPTEQRSQVTYQLIMQHWFLKCAAILSETERIQAMDAIPPALRRANPNMSRDYFLRNRSQPFFLLSLTDVGQEAAEELAQIQDGDLASSTGKLQSSQPGTPELRPASATARLLYGSSTSVSSPVRFGTHDGGGARIRPSSCSALSRGRSGGGAGSRAVSARSHWHQRVTSTPAGASGAVVTPHSTGRVVPPATLQRPPPPPSARKYSAADATPAPLPAYASNAPALLSMLAPKAADTYAQLKARALKMAHRHGDTQATAPAHPQGEAQQGSTPPLAHSSRPAAVSSPPRSSQSTSGQALDQPTQLQSPGSRPAGAAIAPSVFDPLAPAAMLGASGALSDTRHSGGSLGSGQRVRGSADEAQTLKELADAYSEAEQLTKALLAQANQLLRTPGSATAAAAAGAAAADGPTGGPGAQQVQEAHAASGTGGHFMDGATGTGTVAGLRGSRSFGALGVARTGSGAAAHSSAAGGAKGDEADMRPGTTKALETQEALPLARSSPQRPGSGGLGAADDSAGTGALSPAQRPALSAVGSRSARDAFGSSLPPRPTSALRKSGSSGSVRPMSARLQASSGSLHGSRRGYLGSIRLQGQASTSGVHAMGSGGMSGSAEQESIETASKVPAAATTLTAEEEALLYEAVSETLL